MTELSNDVILKDLQHFNQMAHEGKDFQCELQSMPRDEQLQLVHAAKRPQFAAYTDALTLHVDASTYNTDWYLTAKTPPTEGCVVAQKVEEPAAQPVIKTDELPRTKFEGWHIDAPAKANEISQYISGDLKGDQDAKGWLRKKLCDLQEDYPADRDKVLLILEHNGAQVTRDAAGKPLSIKFSSGRFFGTEDTIDLTQNFADMAKVARDSYDQGVERTMTHWGTSVEGYLYHEQLANKSLPEKDIPWCHRPEFFQ